MKNLVLIAFILVIPLFLSAQFTSGSVENLIEIKEGPVYKTKNVLEDIFATDDDHFYAILKKHKVVKLGFGLDGNAKKFLARFSKDMELEQETEMEMEYEGNNLDFERVFMHNGQIYLFTSFLNKKQKKRYAFYQTVDKKTLIPNDDIVKLGEIPGDRIKDIKSSGFSILRSEDNSKILVYYDIPTDEDANDRFGLHLFDENMQKLWSEEVELPYAENLFAIESKKLSNSGDVYVMGSLWKEKSERERKGVNYSYKIVSLTDMGKNITEYDIELDGRFVNNLFLRFNDKNELLCGGFFRNKGSTGADGSFYVKVDRSTKQVVQKSFNEFDERFVMEDMRKREKKKASRKSDKGKEIGISKLKIDDFIVREDGGGGVIVGERQWIETRTYTSNGRQRTVTIFHHHDIVLVSIGADGNIEWNARIPKEQSTSNSNWYSSYMMSVVGSSLFFIFNDNPKNMTYNGDGKLHNFTIKKNYVALVEVDKDGMVFRRTLMDGSGKRQPIVRPLVSEQVTKEEIYLYSERGKNKQFLKLKFKG